jgi:hypothetical protein
MLLQTDDSELVAGAFTHKLNSSSSVTSSVGVLDAELSTPQRKAAISHATRERLRQFAKQQLQLIQFLPRGTLVDISPPELLSRVANLRLFDTESPHVTGYIVPVPSSLPLHEGSEELMHPFTPPTTALINSSATRIRDSEAATAHHSCIALGNGKLAPLQPEDRVSIVYMVSHACDRCRIRDWKRLRGCSLSSLSFVFSCCVVCRFSWTTLWFRLRHTV